MIQFVLYSINAFLSIFLLYHFLSIKLNKQFFLLFIVTTVEFFILNNLLLIFIYLIFTIFYLYKFNSIDFNDAILFSLLTIIIYMSSSLIKNSFLPNWSIQYFNNFEITIIHFFIILFITKFYCSKKNQYMKKQVIFSLSLGTLALLFIVIFFAKITLGKNLNNIEKTVGSFSVIFLCYLLLKYYRLFNDSFTEIDISKQINNNYKYRIISQSKLAATYEKSNKMNHNTKYILLNLKYLLNNKKYNESTDYINNILHKIEKNQVIFTNNPYLDYLINNFNESLNNLNLSCNKNINVSKNSPFFNQTYCEQINEYFNYQLVLIKEIIPKSISLIINEKSDFLVMKVIFCGYNKCPSKINCDYKYENDLLITSLILEQTDD